MGQYTSLKNFLAIELEYLVKVDTIQVEVFPAFDIRVGVKQQTPKMVMFKVHGPNLSVTL